MRTRSHYMTRRAYTIQQGVEETRPKLRRAFQALRKIGIYARMDFLCCSSCGMAACTEVLDKQPRWKGVTFWHHQDEERFSMTGEMYLAHAPRNEAGGIFLAREIVAELNRFGVMATWDGNLDHRIIVKTLKMVPVGTQLELELRGDESRC